MVKKILTCYNSSCINHDTKKETCILEEITLFKGHGVEVVCDSFRQKQEDKQDEG